jgi:large subunit ribosomal protein L3
LELRTKEKNGYEAAVLGFEPVEGARLKSKPQLGFFKKLSSPVFKVIREFRGVKAEVNQEVSVESFKPGDQLQIQGVSRGKGWAGAIKRWNFSRGRETHGGNFNRALGSTGNNTWPARTIPGRRMSGRLGFEKVSIKNVEVVAVMPEDHLLIVKGPVPGGEHGLLRIERIAETKTKAAS